MDALTLNAQSRTLGRSAARAARRAGEVPCVLYGPHQEPVHFQVPVLDLRQLIYSAETHRVSINLEGNSYDCIARHVDFDPVTDVPAHIDFYALTAGEEVSMTVPVVLVGTSVGVLAGGILSQSLNDLEIRCLPKYIPNQIEVDVTDLQVGDSLHVSDLNVENVTVMADESRTVVSVSAPAAAEAETTELVVEEGEAVEAEASEATAEEGEE